LEDVCVFEATGLPVVTSKGKGRPAKACRASPGEPQEVRGGPVLGGGGGRVAREKISKRRKKDPPLRSSKK